jgi:hypothetical protein
MYQLFARFKALNLVYKAHLSALALFLIQIFLSRAFPELRAVHQFLALLALLGFATGFCLWCWPFAATVWKRPAGKVLIAITNVIVLLLATTLSRNVVASALGLPPQDFDIAVSALALFFYIPASSLIVAIGVGLIGLGLELHALTAGLRPHRFVEMTKTLAHMMGAFALVYFSASLFDFVMKNEKLLHPAVKWVALIGDFQPAASYPGVLPNDRIRLHENGVISSARIDRNEVLITIKKYEQ